MAPKLSGLQREVLALYRRALRMVRTKPPTSQHKFRLFVRYTFHTQVRSVTPRNIGAIEHMLRKGRAQLETYERKEVKDCWVSREMQQWGEKEDSQRAHYI